MDLQLPTPESFPEFPYSPPYEIQTDLMRHLYESIEQKKVTIVESPTGTVSTGLGGWNMDYDLRLVDLGKDVNLALRVIDLAV